MVGVRAIEGRTAIWNDLRRISRLGACINDGRLRRSRLRVDSPASPSPAEGVVSSGSFSSSVSAVRGRVVNWRSSRFAVRPG